jgi:hypothetical protein
VLRHGENHVEIARRAPGDSGFPLPNESQSRTRIDAGRNLHRNSLLPLDAATSPAIATRIRDHLTRTSADITRAIDPEEALLKRNLSYAATPLAGLGPTAIASARTRTGLAGARLRNRDRGLAAQENIVQINFEVVTEVCAAICPPAGAPARKATPVPEDVSEEVAEEIREAAEIAEIRGAGLSGACDALMAETVIASPLLGIRKHRVGLRDLLESLLGVGIVGIAIRMALERQLAIGLLELSLAAFAGDAKNLVVVAFSHGEK